MELRTGLVEVASGVDALYLSGHAEAPRPLLASLSDAQRAAQIGGEPVEFEIAGHSFRVTAGPFGKYKFRLEHPYGLVGITDSDNLPPVRVQLRADYLHGVGPEVAAGWFMLVLEDAFGGPDSVGWSVSRLDLFCDVQGWDLTAADLARFSSRASLSGTFADGERLTGFTFGKRGANFYARVYDKTVEAGGKGMLAAWEERWTRSGNYTPGGPVWRIEFEMNKAAVRQLVHDRPEGVLDRLGGIWGYVTDKWLTFRIPGSDSNRSRWPLAPEWLVVQGASMRGDALGYERVRGHVLTHGLTSTGPALLGYVSKVGALMDSDSLDEALAACGTLISRQCRRTGRTFDDVMLSKRRNWGIA